MLLHSSSDCLPMSQQQMDGLHCVLIQGIKAGALAQSYILPLFTLVFILRQDFDKLVAKLPRLSWNL